MNPATRPFPLPRDVAPDRGSDTLVRAALVNALTTRHRGQADEILRQAFPQTYHRSAVSPTTTAATAIAPTGVADFIIGLSPQSAGAELVRRGLRASLQGYATIQIPAHLVVAADGGGFTGEGEPLQVRTYPITNAATLSPKKFGCVVAYTEELADHAVRSFEQILKQMLTEAAGLALDAALFSTTAASSIRPAGLLSGVTGLTATAGGGESAVSKDIGNLFGALATATDVVIVAARPQAASLKVWASPRFDYPILGSAALANGTVIAVDAAAFVSAFGPEPDFTTSRDAVLHTEAETPLPIIDGAGVVASPTRSLFQTNCLATKMTLKTSWAMRAASVAFVTAVTW